MVNICTVFNLSIEVLIMSKSGKTVEISHAELSGEARAEAIRKHGFLRASYIVDSKKVADVLSKRALADREYMARKGYGMK